MMVSDYPNLAADQNRVTQSLTLFDQFTQESTPDINDADLSSDPKKETAGKTKTSQRISQSKPQPALAAHDHKSLPARKVVLNKYFLFATLGILSAAIVLSAIYYFISIHNLDTAGTARKQCASLIESHKFEDAKQSCDDAFSRLGRIKFIEQGKVQELQVSVQQILQSEKLSQGLAGNILIEEK